MHCRRTEVRGQLLRDMPFASSVDAADAYQQGSMGKNKLRTRNNEAREGRDAEGSLSHGHCVMATLQRWFQLGLAKAETMDALELLAPVVSHIPNKGQVLQRYYCWYASRTRRSRRKAGPHEQRPVVEAEAVPPALAQARRRWAELLRRIFEVDPSWNPHSLVQSNNSWMVG